jgi:CRP-like cAMP-binding protein/thioredoxin reductase/Fe-S-cluster-containing hydrogenase component 2
MAQHFDIAVIGAGPAGLGAASNAAHYKISHVLFEKSEIANTIFEYQKGKHVMAEPGKLPLRSHVPFAPGSRESILSAWEEVLKEKQVNLVKAEVLAIKKVGEIFQIDYTGSSCTANKVVLCIGVQGTPRKLGVPGEDQEHVAYTLSDPDDFKDKSIVVVGAGDSAIENVIALSKHNSVAIINRSAEFSRAKDANVRLIQAAIQSGKVRCFSNAQIARVDAQSIQITTPEGEVTCACDHLIVRAGANLPRKFLEKIGIGFAGDKPDAIPAIDDFYQSTTVSGLYLLGALIGYPLIKHAINQGHEVIEHLRGNTLEPADQVLVNEKLEGLPGSIRDNYEAIRRGIPLFTDLNEPQFREMLIDSTVHLKKKGEVIFERNDYTDSFYSIVGGSVMVELPSGGNLTIGAGNFFGEMGLISGRRRTATIKAATDCLLVETPRKQILKLMSSVASVKRQLDEVFMLRALETSIFPDADKAFLRELTKKATLKNFKKGEKLFAEGDIGDALYVIRKGSVKISRKDRHARDICFTYLPAGNFVGEMALLAAEDTPRSATITAAVGCETIVIQKADFQNLLASSPKVRERISQLVQERKIENITEETDHSEGQVLDFIFQEGLSDASNVLVIDSDLCIACDNCESACAATHKGYSRLDRKGGKFFAAVQIPISCRHCENPLCMTDCPPDALTRLPDGEVVIRDNCIGCGNCVSNCPYGVIQLVYDKKSSNGFSLLSMLGLKKKEKGSAKAAKCDMCAELDGGPACVRACPTGAAIRVSPSELINLMQKKGGMV